MNTLLRKVAERNADFFKGEKINPCNSQKRRGYSEPLPSKRWIDLP